ncbi:DUF2946 family protein [Propionivibrio sp.]|uniref:DUF2946 family protein n=1 Tax=Propionivibrio sp. TaxID=2212460 RepID=UPI0025F9EA43|nr:DUF2946 family protein [Propionivibrio sp.]MBK8746262.1 DUF2946 family protein [Propionivibrio sp.]MBK8894418.1 DUF2946 family protein [Propionivibrio sp.]MBL0207383.1 DUF2946 family protein [Propionivibrio sp.]
MHEAQPTIERRPTRKLLVDITRLLYNSAHVNTDSSALFWHFRRRGRTFLVLGLLAVALQLWAALGIMPKAGADGSIVGQICTVNGLITVQLPTAGSGDSVPSHDNHSDHSCCTYCGSTPTLFALAGPGAVSQTLAFVARTWNDSGINLPAGRYRLPPSHAPPFF